MSKFTAALGLKKNVGTPPSVRRFLKRSRKLRRKGFSFKGVFRKSNTIWRRSRRELFKDRGQIYPDLTEQRKKEKRKLGKRPYPILVFSGALKKSVVGAGAGRILKVGKTKMVWGSFLYYGKFLQKKRNFLFFGKKNKFATPETKAADRKIMKMIYDSLEKQVAKGLGAKRS